MTGGSTRPARQPGPAGTVVVVVPAGIDDPCRPSGGNTYDRRLCSGLADARWMVREHRLAGDWPYPDESDRAAVGDLLGRLPAGGLVLVDGLIASAVPDELRWVAVAGARLIVLVHLPLGVAAGPGSPTAASERDALSRADTVIATSRWTRDWLVDHYGLPADRLHVAEPGVVAAALTPPTRAGGRLLCVGALAPHKGQDVLITALATATPRGFAGPRSGVRPDERDWCCRLVGPEADPAYARSVRDLIAATGLDDGIELTGPLPPTALDALYADTDLLLVPSRIETYGMVVLEALARGIPVVATTAGGLPQTVGLAADGTGPGLLVPPDDPARLADALRRWLTDKTLRRRLRDAAAARRATLPGWSTTVERVATAFTGVAA